MGGGEYSGTGIASRREYLFLRIPTPTGDTPVAAFRPETRELVVARSYLDSKNGNVAAVVARIYAAHHIATTAPSEVKAVVIVQELGAVPDITPCFIGNSGEV
jgi:hypothetical protein